MVSPMLIVLFVRNWRLEIFCPTIFKTLVKFIQGVWLLMEGGKIIAKPISALCKNITQVLIFFFHDWNSESAASSFVCFIKSYQLQCKLVMRGGTTTCTTCTHTQDTAGKRIVVTCTLSTYTEDTVTWSSSGTEQYLTSEGVERGR